MNHHAATHTPRPAPHRGRRPARTTAFTLIELITVVAIIAILAAIAVPNFLEAQVRAKTARMRGDMAVLAASLRAYFADHNRYPPNDPERRAFLETVAKMPGTFDPSQLATPTSATISWSYGEPGFNTRARNLIYRDNPPHYRNANFSSPMIDWSGYDLTVLTTPVPYLTGILPVDVYSDDRGHQVPVMYINLVDLAGAPTQEQTGEAARRFVLLSTGPDRNISFRNPVTGPFLDYDPTNGTISQGDLVLFGHGTKPARAADWSDPPRKNQNDPVMGGMPGPPAI